MEGGEGEAYLGDEQMKVTDPRAGIPQEAITGDILRGYGPRRGNLERLLRYWRPIMKKPGGFRRCLVILANHPELYPLQNICAWLHHETTGLWPNEGCHHPGMKNCRRKLRGVRNGSVWSNAEFNNRIRKLGNEKGVEWDDDVEIVTDADVKFANGVLNEFLMEEKDFAEFLADEKNWTHMGDDQNGNEIEHDWVKPDDWDAPKKGGGCGCGCKSEGGAGSCSPQQSVEDSLADLQEKVGRKLNSRNSQRINEAIRLLSEVLGQDAPVIQQKDDGGVLVAAPVESLFLLRETLEPVIDFYGLDAEIDEDGVHLTGVDLDLAEKALERVVGVFPDIQIKDAMDVIETKGIGRRLMGGLPGRGRPGRGGRGGGRRGGGGRGRRGAGGGKFGNMRFDRNAEDADGDGMLQDGTPFERPKTPKKPVAGRKPRRGGVTPVEGEPGKRTRLGAAANDRPLKEWSDTPLASLYDDVADGKRTNYDPDDVKNVMDARFDDRIKEMGDDKKKLQSALDAAKETSDDEAGPAEKLWRKKLEDAIGGDKSNDRELKEFSDTPLASLYDDVADGKSTNYDADDVKKAMNDRWDDRIKEMKDNRKKLQDALKAIKDNDDESPAEELWRQKLNDAVNDFNVNELLGTWQGDGDLPKDFDKAFEAYTDDDETMSAAFSTFNGEYPSASGRNAGDYADDFASYVLDDAIEDNNLKKRQILRDMYEDMWSD